jgi:hypothetical protein
MSSQLCSPTIALDPSNNWIAESAALLQDGNSTVCSGAGKLVLKTFDNRLLVPGFNQIVGFEVELWGAADNVVQFDSFADAAGSLLKFHDGELNCDWQKPFTGANPVYQRINAQGRTYYAFENEDGPSNNGAEHFTSNFNPPTANYAVEAVIYRATDGGAGERAEIYARATLPYNFYYMSYLESTDSWEIGVSSGAGSRTILGTYNGDSIPLGGSRTAKLEVNGTSIKGFVDGVLRMAGSNAAYSAAGFAGIRLDAGANRNSVYVTAMYDMGTPTVITRCGRRHGTAWGNSYGLIWEASNDGVNWVNANIGVIGPGESGSGTFTWATCVDDSSITSTPYRYWRTVVRDTGIGADARISDFRIYTSSGMVVPDGVTITTRGYVGTAPGNWSDGTETNNFSDGSLCDNTTWIGGPGSVPGPEESGLQFEQFAVRLVLPDSIRVGLSKDGSTFAGTPKTLLLQPEQAKYTMGTPIDSWGDNWTPFDIQSSEFAILIERTTANSTPYIDHARVIIYHTGSGGTFTMGYRETTRQRIQYGWESSFGTAVAANKRLRSIHIVPQANPEFKTFRPAGEKLDSEQMITKESATAAISGQPCYNELGVLFKLMNGAPVTSGSLNQRQEHFFRFENRGEQKGSSITCEYGEDPSNIDVFGVNSTFNRGSRIKAFTLAEMGIELSRSEAALSGNAFAHKLELDHVMSAGLNDQQTITITATGGSFKARWNGSAWVTINLPIADATALDTALEGISTIGPSGLLVTGSGPYVVEFSGTGLAGKVQPLIEIDSTNATGGTVTISHTRPGGVQEFPIVPILPEHVNVYLADTIATLSSNRMQRCSVMNFSMSDRFSPFWVFNRSNGGNFLDKAEGTGIGARFAIKAHADSEATSLLGTARSNAKKFIRIEAIGPTADGVSNYEFVLDAAVKVAAVGQMEDEDGMYMCNYELALTEDRSWGNALTVWLRNMMTATDYQ